jgi:hypothetical protein
MQRETVTQDPDEEKYEPANVQQMYNFDIIRV